jgi:hypothetical protein
MHAIVHVPPHVLRPHETAREAARLCETRGIAARVADVTLVRCEVRHPEQALLFRPPMRERTGSEKTRRQRGAAVVEMSLVSGLFFMSLLPIFDFGRTWYVASNLQSATRSTARLITVGALTGTLTNQAVSSLLSRESGLDLAGVAVAVTSTAITGSGAGTGAAGQLITVTARLDVPLVTPFLQAFFDDGVYHANASATFLKEVATGV